MKTAAVVGRTAEHTPLAHLLERDPVALESQDAALARLAPELRATASAAATLRLLGSGSAMALMPHAIVPR